MKNENWATYSTTYIYRGVKVTHTPDKGHSRIGWPVSGEKSFIEDKSGKINTEEVERQINEFSEQSKIGVF